VTEYVILRSANFDSAIKANLLLRSDAIADPLGTATVMLIGTDSDDMREYFTEERIERPTEFPYCTLVRFEPGEVVVFHEFASEAKLISSRSFVAWVLAHYDCEVLDNYGNDWTARVKADGVDVLYAGARLPPMDPLSSAVTTEASRSSGT
jgi:hypothetical protein